MASEDLRVPYEQVDVEDARREMLTDRLEHAGWITFGTRSDGTIDEGFCRKGGRYDLTPEETAVCLGLVDDEGNMLAGFNIQAANAAGATIIQYKGPQGDRYSQFIEDLHDLGRDLDHQLEAEAHEFEARLAQARESMAEGDEAVAKFLNGGAKISEDTNRLMRQINDAEADDGTIKEMVDAGTPRAEAIAACVSAVATTFYEDLQDAGYTGEVDFLQRWHAHVDYRYTKLFKALEPQYSGSGLGDFIAANPTLEKLSGIREGLERVLTISQERATQKEQSQQLKDRFASELIDVADRFDSLDHEVAFGGTSLQGDSMAVRTIARQIASNKVAKPLSKEVIREQTGFKLFAVFTDFSRKGEIVPDLHEERERLSAELGEDNVLPSLFVDDKGEIQLGLFTREPR